MREITFFLFICYSIIVSEQPSVATNKCTEQTSVATSVPNKLAEPQASAAVAE